MGRKAAPNATKNAIDRNLQALSAFKDWSNYLLVTTTVALGWVSTSDVLTYSYLRLPVIFCFAFSVMFAIFALALVPLVAEKIDKATSMYEVEPSYRLLPGKKTRTISNRLKTFCWPQHVLFLLGILLYAVGAAKIDLWIIETAQRITVNPW